MKLNIPEDKENNIYISALNEFSINGYENGSTNTIIKNAGISKGSLFKYFGSKANLFIYVTDRAIGTLDKEIFKDKGNLSSDMFERITQLTNVKVEVSLKYKKESTILVESLKVQDDKVKKYINDIIQYYYKIMKKIFTDGIDYSKFKDDVDAAKVYEILIYISDGLQKKYLKKYNGSFDLMVQNIDEMYEDTFSYIGIIRDSVYK